MRCSFLSSEFQADVNHHSYSAKILVLGIPWRSYACTPISLIARAATPLMRFSGRLLQILTVSPLPFVSVVHFIDIHPPPTATPPTFLDVHLPGPTSASIIFTPTHVFYDPYRGDFNDFGWINHRGIWSSHCEPHER